MNKFLMMFVHYFRRALVDPVGMLALIVLPIGLIFINTSILPQMMAAVGEDIPMIGNINIAETAVAVAMLVMFQLMGGSYLNDWIWEDFRSDRRWRLFSAPLSRNRLIFTSAAASYAFTLFQGLVIATASTLLFDVSWGSRWWVVLLAVVLLSSISHLLYLLASLLLKTKRAAEGAVMALTFAQAIMAGIMFVEIPALTRIPTPFVLGLRAINQAVIFDDMTRSLTNLGWLAVTAVALAVVAFIVGRRRKI